MEIAYFSENLRKLCLVPLEAQILRGFNECSVPYVGLSGKDKYKSENDQICSINSYILRGDGNYSIFKR